MKFAEGLLLMLVCKVAIAYEEYETTRNCTPSSIAVTPTNDVASSTVLSYARHDAYDLENFDVLMDNPKEVQNASRKMIIDTTDLGPPLKFPKDIGLEFTYKMANLRLDDGAIFDINGLRTILGIIQPMDVPFGLLMDLIDQRMDVKRAITELIRVESALLILIVLCCLMVFVLPGTELWLACRPIESSYKPVSRSGVFTFLLGTSVLVLCSANITMIICNEAISAGIHKLPIAIEAALNDIGDYHSGTTTRLRKSLTRSLDVANEAVLADLDNVEDLLGKPVQSELSSETGVDVALDALQDVANASQVLASMADTLNDEAERAKSQGDELARELDTLRRDLETTVGGCTGQDRPLCATIDPAGMRLAFKTDRLLRDSRLLRLRDANRENLTVAVRQARGEYLHVPHHIARSTLDARNLIRREINAARARILEEARGIESRSDETARHVESARAVANRAIPYVIEFEYFRWYVGFGTVLCVLPIWLLILGALCCGCGSSSGKVRPTLLCGVLTNCLMSVALWSVFVGTLAIASHVEMIICRPLYDPEFRTIEAVLESRNFLGRRTVMPLKDLFEKCEKNEAGYPLMHLDDSAKLDKLTAHWNWPGLAKSINNLKVDLRGLRILTPSLQHQLQNLLYACGLNLTDHRVAIQGPVLYKDLSSLADQCEGVARQMRDRNTAVNLQNVAYSMRDLSAKGVKSLMKQQDELVYRLAALELHVQPLQRQVNQSISHLKTIQYYIDNQGQMIVRQKTKSYSDRLTNYLDQWRTHVLTEMSSNFTKCRPLFDILQGLRLLFCRHILGPMNGFWLSTLVCLLFLLILTPVAHVLSLAYKKVRDSKKDIALLPARSESPDTVVIDRDTWQTPVPPPMPPSDGW